VGILPGQTVTYSATIDFPGDGFTANDSGSAIVIAA
jgi:hypothetical protein